MFKEQKAFVSKYLLISRRKLFAFQAIPPKFEGKGFSDKVSYTRVECLEGEVKIPLNKLKSTAGGATE